jgi:hypothetical protein
MKIKSIISTLGVLALALSLSAGVMAASSPVVMRLLIVATSQDDISYQSITTYLNQIGIPYQSVFVKSLTPDASGNRLSGVSLSDSTTGNGLYQGIIQTDSSFSVCSTTCQSLLSDADWSKLNTYASQFSVRVVSYYTYPDPKWGLLPADSGASYKDTTPLSVNLTKAGVAIFSYLNAASSIPVSGKGDSGIWIYRATPTAAVGESTTPLLTAGAYTVGVAHTTADGRETLALTMDNYPGLLHSTALSYGVINWVTKGVFLGSRRVYLNPQIDDMLLGNRLYAPTRPECPQDQSCPTVFATGSDLQALANWQTKLQSDPQFQSFRTTFAYNGIGTTWFPPDDPIFAAIASLNSRFTWLSHTWSHANLDCYTVDSNEACVPATLAESQAELNQNIAVAPSLGIAIDPTSMVTPFNGGLTDPNFLQAAAQAGIHYIVAAADPPSTNTGIVSPILPSIFEIPRRTPNVFDDVSSPQTGAYGSWPDEYNAKFGPNGTQPLYSQNQNYSEILDNESENILRANMLTYEPYPLAFHIDNSSMYDGTHSLYTDLIDETITKYKKLFSLPVITIDMKDLGPLLMNRASYDASGVVGVYTPGIGVVLTTNKAATIPVTGACAQTSCATYGGQFQDNVAMAANSTVTLSLTASEGVALAALSLNPENVTSGTPSTGTVTLSGAAPTGGLSVSLSSNNASATVPATVTVAAGNTNASFIVTTKAVTSSASATITASYSGISKTAAFTITPAIAVALSSVSVNPTSVVGGTSSTGTVTLSGAAPTGGLTVSLTSNNASATVPSTVAVAAGNTTTSFTIATKVVSSSAAATITARYNSVSKTAALTITPAAALSSVTLNPTGVTGGASSTGTVTLSSAAPTGGIAVTLSSNNVSATVPTTVTVAAGSKTAVFTITTKAVGSSASATITARYNSVNKTAALTITPAATVALSSVSVSPTSVVGGTSATGTVTLSGAAPSGGLVVELWTTGTAAFVPENITIAAGSTTGTFNVTTTSGSGSRQDTVTAFYIGASKTAPITVTP